MIDLEFLYKAHQQIFESDINWEWKRLIQLISLVYLIFFILSLPKSLNYLLLSISSFLIIYVIMLYVASYLRQPERVQVSVIFLSILVGWTSFIFTKESNFKNLFNPQSILSSLMLIIVISSTFGQALYLKSKFAGASNVFWQTESSYLSQFPNESIFVGNASQFRNNWISPYKIEYLECHSQCLRKVLKIYQKSHLHLK